MTWTKLSDDYAEQCANLSDAAHRTHTDALVWTMRRETGGFITPREVRRFAETNDPDAAIRELVEQGFWTEESDGYRIVHHMEHQPEPEVLEQRRQNSNERKRKQRHKDVGLPP